MSGRPHIVGGVAALVVGGLLLVLGLEPGRGGAEPAAASSLSRTVERRTGIAPSADLRTSADESAAGTSNSRAATQELSLPGPSAPQAPDARSTPTAVEPTPTSRVVSGVRLEVPAIGLDISVKAGGVSASGRVVPPAGRATWVRGFGRVAPGGVGTAVVAGHVSAYGKPDVFADLSSVRVGHELVVRSGSVVRTYAVTRVRVVDKADLTRDAEVWGQNGSQRRLVLITCDDDLGFRKDGHRVANYVVVAEAT